MEMDVEPCCSSSSSSNSTTALINSFSITKGCEPTFVKKCVLKIRPLLNGEKINAITSLADLPIRYVEKLLLRTKFYENDPLNENECVDISSCLIFSNNPFVSRNYSPIIILQDIIDNKSNNSIHFVNESKSFHYFIPTNAVQYLADFCPFGIELTGKFDVFNYIVFKDYYSKSDRDLFCQQAAKIMSACRNNELFFQYSTNIYLKPQPLKDLECGLSIYDGFEMKQTKLEEKEEFVLHQICSIQKVFFTSLPLDSAIQKCFEYPHLCKAFSHHCLSFSAAASDQNFLNTTTFDICEIKFFDDKAIWNNDQNLYKISAKEKYANKKEVTQVWGPKYLYEMYQFEKFTILPFQECSSNFWPSEVYDTFVQKSDSPKIVQQKILKIIEELNFLNEDNNIIKPDWYTQKIEILQFPSILFRTESIIPNKNGKFISATNIPIIYGTKTKWSILYSSETYLPFFKPLINSTAISLSYSNIINILYQKFQKSSEIHAEIIKCNTVDEMLIILDTGNIPDFNETITFAKTKNPDAAIFILKLKDLKKLLNKKLKMEEMAKFQRLLNFKMSGLNHTPNYAKFLSTNSIDVKPNEILFFSHFFLPPKFPNNIGTTGFAFNFMPIKCQPIGKIAFQFTNRTQFYTLHKFCEFITSKLKQQQNFYFPKIIFIGTIDSNEREEICEFNAKMDLNIISKHFNSAILVYLSFTQEHTFRAFGCESVNLQMGACIDDPIEKNTFYIFTQSQIESSNPNPLKVRILLNQPGLSKASIKHFIFTQCFCNQITLESDPYPSTLMYSMKLAQKGVNVIEVLKKNSPASFSGNAEDDARYCNKAIAIQNIKYQCMDNDKDEDVENVKKVVKSRKTSNP